MKTTKSSSEIETIKPEDATKIVYLSGPEPNDEANTPEETVFYMPGAEHLASLDRRNDGDL